MNDDLHPETAAAPFVPTSIARAVHEAANFAITHRRATAVIGPAGIGKSTALHRLAESNPLALYGEARNFRAMKYLLQFVFDGFNLYTANSRSNYHLTQIIAEHMPGLASRGHILIIDEQQELSLDALREVVGYSEDFRLPVLLVGNERSLKLHPRQDAYTHDQILSRISKITALKSPTIADYADFARANGVSHPAAVEACANYGLCTSFRAVRDLLAVAAGPGAAEPVTLDRLKAALVFVTDDPRSVRQFKPLSKAA